MEKSNEAQILILVSFSDVDIKIAFGFRDSLQWS